LATGNSQLAFGKYNSDRQLNCESRTRIHACYEAAYAGCLFGGANKHLHNDYRLRQLRIWIV